MRVLLAGLALTLATPIASASGLAQAGPETSPPAGRLPTLHVTRVVTGLDIPWDVKPIGKGDLLITERDRRRLLLRHDGHTRVLSFPRQSVWSSGETGLMSLAIDPGFSRNRRFYTCQGGFLSGGGHDVRIMAWRLNDTRTGAVFQRKLLGGLPASSGRHGGCRLLIANNKALLVGTGDAAIGTNPQNLRSLGGKVLRLNRWTGAPWPDNPWPMAPNRHRRYLLTYGHRNVQGLTQRADGTLWSVEHGTYRDDEVNRLVKGGNYGYNPVPGYNETVPMTDFSLPGRQIGARWSSGDPTKATSGAAWVRGSDWGVLNGTLAVAALKSSQVLFMRFDADGHLKWVRSPAVLHNYGRLRSVTRAADGDLLLTTSNGSGRDVVLRVSP